MIGGEMRLLYTKRSEMREERSEIKEKRREMKEKRRGLYLPPPLHSDRCIGSYTNTIASPFVNATNL
jgi:hypothetical protein